jgi:hypothetical protein
LIILNKALFEGCQRLVDGLLREENFGGPGPDHYLPVALRLELGDVVANLIGQIALVLPCLDLFRIEALNVAVIEGSGHWLNVFKEGTHLSELVTVQHGGRLRSVVQSTAEDVPAGENKIVKLRDGCEVFNERRVVIGALAQANGTHLRHGADRLRHAATYGLYACNQCGRHSSHAGDHDAEFALRGLDISRSRGIGGCGGHTLLRNLV